MEKRIKRMISFILALAVVLGSLPGFLNTKTVYAEERLKDFENILVELGYSDAKVIRGIPGAEPVVPTQEDIDYLRQKENKSFSIQASRLPGLNSAKQFHVQNAETGNYYTIDTTLKRIGAHSLIYVEDGRTLEDAFLDRVVREFEKIYDKNVEVFGTPLDVDKDPHIKIVLLDIQVGLGKTSTVTIIARDEKGSVLKNHQFYADITIINNNSTTEESSQFQVMYIEKVIPM